MASVGAILRNCRDGIKAAVSNIGLAMQLIWKGIYIYTLEQ